MSAYIPTNVISITDGQIFLRERPVLSPGCDRPSTSVSRSVASAGQQRADQSHEGRSPARLQASNSPSSASSKPSPSSAPTSIKTTQAPARRAGGAWSRCSSRASTSPLSVELQVLSIVAGTKGVSRSPSQVPHVQASSNAGDASHAIHTDYPEILDRNPRRRRQVSAELEGKILGIIDDYAKKFAGGLHRPRHCRGRLTSQQGPNEEPPHGRTCSTVRRLRIRSGQKRPSRSPRR